MICQMKHNMGVESKKLIMAGGNICMETLLFERWKNMVSIGKWGIKIRWVELKGKN